MAPDGRHADPRARRRRVIATVVVVAIVALAFGGGYLLARDDTPVRADRTSPHSATPSHTKAPPPSPTPSPTPSATPTPTSSADALPDGRSFVYAKKVSTNGGGTTLTFDLAEFLTDQAAIDAAAAHGDETPPPNGYYIVNDNPKLRTMPFTPTVVVRYYPTGGPACCHHQPGTLDGFEAAVNGSAPTDYPDMSYTPWWITVSGGEIVKISQQYLP